MDLIKIRMVPCVAKIEEAIFLCFHFFVTKMVLLSLLEA